MAKITRITIMLLSCVSLSILGTSSAASAHVRHFHHPTHVAVHHAGAGRHSNGDAWCC